MVVRKEGGADGPVGGGGEEVGNRLPGHIILLPSKDVSVDTLGQVWVAIDVFSTSGAPFRSAPAYTTAAK